MPTNQRATAVLEILVYGAIVIVCAAIFAASLGLPSSNREPLGSASIPQAVSVIIAVLCAILLARAVAVLRAARTPAAAEPAAPQSPAYRPRYDLAIGIFVLALVFAAVLQQRLVPANILIPAFIGLAMWMLNRFRLRALLPSLAIAVGVGLATTYVFKNFFYIDLP